MAAEERLSSPPSSTSTSVHNLPGNASQKHEIAGSPVEESLDARLERLGRQRPEVFPNLLAEIGFVFSVCMSQVLSVSSICFPMY